METFADRLKAAMNEQGLKQVDLVRLAQQKGIKLGKSHVSQYVSGKTIPRTDILHFLADALQVDPDWLNNNNDNDSTLSDVDEIQTSADNSGGMKVREFKKSSKLNNVLYDVRGPVVDEAARMEEMGTHVLKLNIGNPAPFGFRTPDEVIYDMSRQLSDCEGYSASAGLFSARKAIMQYAQLKHLPNVTMSDIYTGNGVSELINLTMSALWIQGMRFLSRLRIIRSGQLVLHLPVESLYTISVMSSLTGIRISRICVRRSMTVQKRSLSSIQTIRPVLFIRRKYCSRL